MSIDESLSTAGSLSFERPQEDRVLVRIAGEWKLKNTLPAADEVIKETRAGPKVRQIAFGP